MPKLEPIKSDTKFSKVAETDLRIRPPVSVSIGCHLAGYMMPEPDCSDPVTMAAGVCKRFACDPPKMRPELKRPLREFVRKFVRKHFTPLPYDSDTSVERWLQDSSYPLWRKKELLDVWENHRGPVLAKETQCGSFGKDEEYPEYKHARAINARHDYFKCLVGPIFKLIEKEVFKLDYFIKKIPVADRPSYITNKLRRVGGHYIQTDYTSFESLFTKEIMESVELELYEYMTQNLPEHITFMKRCSDVLAGKNVCRFKDFRVTLKATRMSGEMCTSLGNGFSNLIFMLFLAERKGCTFVDGVVEGDDGLFIVSGPTPTTEDFLELGLKIKLVLCDKIEEASFCGIIFDPIDLNNIRDPLPVLATFGWAARNYANSKQTKLNGLLRCKALSLLYQYPGCPIIQALANYGLRVTRGVKFYTMLKYINSRSVDQYHRELYIQAISYEHVAKPVGMGTRLLCERMFGISYEEQVNYESYLDGLQTIQPLNPLYLEHRLSSVWADYYVKYVVPKPNDINAPLIPTRKKFRVDEVYQLTRW